ncbi:MAG: hypothetical protein WC979_03255 [Candidatus Pacearchaeota archaeon]|jgi:hypothetical protein|nr:hypothetical protein [Clostridia bacterium]
MAWFKVGIYVGDKLKVDLSEWSDEHKKELQSYQQDGWLVIRKVKQYRSNSSFQFEGQPDEKIERTYAFNSCDILEIKRGL